MFSWRNFNCTANQIFWYFNCSTNLGWDPVSHSGNPEVPVSILFSTQILFFVFVHVFPQMHYPQRHLIAEQNKHEILRGSCEFLDKIMISAAAKNCRRQNTIIMHASMYLCSPGDASNKIPLTGVQLIFYRRKEGRSWQVESPAGVIKNTNILLYLDTQVSLCGTQYKDIM